MSILSGFKKIKRYVKTSSGYQLLSQWTSSQTVEMDDGTTLETKMTTKANLASPTLTGTPKAPTASAGTNTTQIATTAFVQSAVGNGIAASDAMIIKGTIGTSGTITTLPTTYKTGWTYRVVTAGTYAGQVCEIGDLIIALIDRNGSGNANSDWCVAQTNINGAITGIKSGDAYITVSQSGSVVTITHKDVTRNDSASTASPASGGTFTAIDSITSDSKGHVTAINTKTITLPTSISGNAETSTNADKVDNFHASSFLGNGTGYVYPATYGVDVNNYKTEFHGFVFNINNIPTFNNGDNYGFLDVSWFNGVGFSPSDTGVVLQRFTNYATGRVYVRAYVSGSWKAWKQLAFDEDVQTLSARGTTKLLAHAKYTDTVTSITLSDSLSNYRYIYAIFSTNGAANSDTASRQAIMPVALFKSQWTTLNVGLSSEDTYFGKIYYTGNDNQVNCQVNDEYRGIWIYGIK